MSQLHQVEFEERSATLSTKRSSTLVDKSRGSWPKEFFVPCNSFSPKSLRTLPSLNLLSVRSIDYLFVIEGERKSEIDHTMFKTLRPIVTKSTCTRRACLGVPARNLRSSVPSIGIRQEAYTFQHQLGFPGCFVPRRYVNIRYVLWLICFVLSIW